MDPFKPRTEPGKLKILRLLNARSELTPDEKQHYINLERGYEGEVKFDLLTADTGLCKKFYIINDLRLEHNNTKFQIDSLFIAQGSILPFEVKNYQGNYVYENGDFLRLPSKNEITNPLHQLDRCKTLLQQLLYKHGFHLPIEEHLIFINPEFFLYQAPLDKPITFHPQLNRFLEELSARPSKLNSGHRKLAEHLLNLHIIESPYENLPPYTYDQVRKGIICANCLSFFVNAGLKKITCGECGHEETIESAVVRSLKELKLLFPEIRITTNIVYEWCQIIQSKKMLLRILKQNYKPIGYGQWTYYE
jgi:hypothetical protein